MSGMNINRKLVGSVGDDLESRFATPYDVGWTFLINFKPECAVEGTQVIVIWGTPGTPQKKIRATVTRYPYNKDLIRNEDKDVSDIPAFK